MLLRLSSRGPTNESRRTAYFTMTGLLTAALLASGLGVQAEPPVSADQNHEFFLDDAGKGEQTYTVTIVGDDDEPAAKKEKKKDEKKGEKKRMIVVQQDGKNILTIPADADIEDVKKQVEKALLNARREVGAARKVEAAGREIAEEARADAEVQRERARGMAEEARRMAEVHREKASQERARVRTAPVVTGFFAEPRLGLRVEKPSAAMADQLDLPKGRGLVVIELVDDSPAGKAGVKTNDIIVEFQGNAVPSDVGAFIKQLRESKDDDTADIIVLRKGRKEKVRNIKLTEVKPGDAKGVWQGVPFDAKDKNFEWKMEQPKDGVFHWKMAPKGDKKEGAKEGRIELKLDGMPKTDGGAFKIDFDLDGFKGVDGKKITEDVKKQIEAKMKAFKEVDGKKLSDELKQVESKLKALNADGQELSGEAKKQLELRLKALRDGKGKLNDIQGKIELELAPMQKKLSDAQKRVRVIAEAEGDKAGGEGKKQSNKSVSVSISDGEFKAVQKEDGLEITIVGEVADEKVTPREIKIYADGEKNTYRSVGDVPPKHRGKVQKLISNQDGGPVRFRFQRDEQ